MEPAKKEESEDQYEHAEFALEDDDEEEEYTMESGSKETSQKPSTEQEKNVFVQVRQ